jgi:hypothetical protein
MAYPQPENAMRKLVSLAFLAVVLTGCWQRESLPHLVDHISFRWIGGTLFTNPDLLTMKEIHLDNGTLSGREIIIEGKVAEVSPHGTYLVLIDDTARMLVVLTDMQGAQTYLNAEKPKALRVLGTVESGKKGLPQIRAHSLNATDEPPAA